jgi:hypothetical protein
MDSNVLAQSSNLILDWAAYRAFDWEKRKSKLGVADWRLNFLKQPGTGMPALPYDFFPHQQALIGSLPSTKRLQGGFARMMFLEPRPDEARLLPALKCKWNFVGDPHPLGLRLKLGYFVHTSDGIRFAGIRYETPEGPGEHSFYHAQPIISFDKDTKLPSPFTAEWWPTRYPAVAVSAKDPIELIAQMLIGLSGANYLDDCLAQRNFWNDEPRKSVERAIDNARQH